MNFEEGELITLESGKEYLIVSTINFENNNYVYLFSNFKPLEIKLGKQINENGETKIEMITTKEEKEQIMQLFTDKLNTVTE